MSSSGTEVKLGPYGAIMEPNVGKGFENTVASGDSDGGATCEVFASSFGSDPEKTKQLLETGDLDFALYTVYRPAQPVEGEKYPLLTWGNGTCAQPEGYATLLRYIAAHGFYVVAANSRWVGSGNELRKGLDFMLKANEDSTSPYYQKIDPAKIGVMGHSQGSQGAAAAASDSRIKVVILFNGGSSSSKPFFAFSGDRDIGNPTVSSLRSGVQSSTKGAWIFYHMVPMEGSADGHLTLMTQPERVVEAATAWWQYQLNGDAESKTFFVGADCKLCNKMTEFEFGQKGLQ
jgi:hypothetical protein